MHKDTINFCQAVLQCKFIDWKPVICSSLCHPIIHVDLVITVGGDGRLWQDSHFLDDSVSSVLGVNSGPAQVEEVSWGNKLKVWWVDSISPYSFHLFLVFPFLFVYVILIFPCLTGWLCLRWCKKLIPWQFHVSCLSRGVEQWIWCNKKGMPGSEYCRGIGCVRGKVGLARCETVWRGGVLCLGRGWLHLSDDQDQVRWDRRIISRITGLAWLGVRAGESRVEDRVGATR